MTLVVKNGVYKKIKYVKLNFDKYINLIILIKMEEFVERYNNQYVQLSFTVSGYNQMDQTETQIISCVTFEGNQCKLSPESLIRSGHPDKEDAEMHRLTWIGDTKWERHRVEMTMKVEREKLYDFETEEFKDGEWILMREADNDSNYMGGEEVSIELVNMEDEEVKKLLMPPPRVRPRRRNQTRFKF